MSPENPPLKGRPQRCTFVSLWTVAHGRFLKNLSHRIPEFVTGGKGAGRNFSKKDRAQGHNINWLESNGTKLAGKTRPWSSISKWNDPPEVPWQFKGTVKRRKCGQWPKAGNPRPFPKIVAIILPLIQSSSVAQSCPTLWLHGLQLGSPAH